LIIKNKEATTSIDVRLLAGDKQEQDVAFFLRRAYKEHQKVFVFNDLRFEHHDEIAQIDHLILYPYGFILIESKSITGEIKVNKSNEWIRSYKNQWAGIRSPIQQIQLQEKLLRELLFENRSQILPKLFGMLQESFGFRCWDQLCAISSNAIVHRDYMPKDISKKLVKSEFVVDKLTKLMNIPNNKITSTFNFNSRPEFSSEDMIKISDFLMLQQNPSVSEQVGQVHFEPTVIQSPQVTENNKSTYIADIIDKNETTPAKEKTSLSHEMQTNTNGLACKKCNNTENLQAAWGKYGYYVKCPVCGANTAMKTGCPSCNSKNTKVIKKKAYYHLICQECSDRSEIFIES
jgi:ribosomal protein S27E